MPPARRRDLWSKLTPFAGWILLTALLAGLVAVARPAQAAGACGSLSIETPTSPDCEAEIAAAEEAEEAARALAAEPTRRTVISGGMSGKRDGGG